MHKNQIARVLPGRILRILEKEHLEYEYLQEIRFRTGRPLLFIYRGEERTVRNDHGKPYQVTEEDVREMVDYISHY